MKERLNKSANCFKISFFRGNNILKGTLFRPEAFLELGEGMIAISSLQVAEILYYYFHLKDNLKNVYVNTLFCFVDSAIEAK